MGGAIGMKFMEYFADNMDAYLISIKEHIGISLLVLMVAMFGSSNTTHSDYGDRD